MLHGIHGSCHGGVARDVYRGSAHVEYAVDAEDQRDACGRYADGLEDDDQHDDARAGYRGGADRREDCRKDDLQLGRHIKTQAECLGDEHGGNGLVERGAVHVDRGAERQNEGGDLLGHPEIPLAHLHRDGQGGSAGTRGESQELGRCDPPEEASDLHAGEDFQQKRIGDEAVDQQPQEDYQAVKAKGPKEFSDS